MLKKLISGCIAISMLFSCASSLTFAEERVSEVNAPKKMEYLKRGAFGAYINGGIYLSWRLLGTEPMNTKFNIYRDGELIAEGIDKTNYTDAGGSQYNKYQVSAVINENGEDKEQSLSNYITILQGHTDKDSPTLPYAYFDVPIEAPPTDGLCKYYDANDASVGDLDGDGEYEIILKWDPDNAKDNSQSGVTGNVYIDAYKMNGTRLWRINLGRNIRAGAHYTQFMVYDFDSDGKAEIAVKTAPGSKDASDNYVTKVGVNDTIKNADNSKVYINTTAPKGDKRKGHVLDGPEYLTIFGPDGNALQTVDYKPGRGDVDAWGDYYANRADRMLAGVAYLDGVNPYLIMCRGYYTRVAVAAYRWDGNSLLNSSGEPYYYYDTIEQDNKKGGLYGQGNHQISVADLDNDGKDEIIYGSAALDDDFTVLHTMGYGHGDALHVSDFDNDKKQEIFGVLEEGQHGTNLREGDGKTDKWRTTAEGDTGRGIMAVASEKYGAIGWSSQTNDYVYLVEPKDAKKGEPKTIPLQKDQSVMPNFGIWWDGDYLREFADGDKIDKWYDNASGEGGSIGRYWTISRTNPIATNNYTKKNPCLQADLFGDWREEYVLRLADNSALRVFTSLVPTEYKFTTFMHDSQYRCAVAWQNTGYNQPPHQSYYIGPGMKNEELTNPNIEMVAPNKVSFEITDQENNPIRGIGVQIDGVESGATSPQGTLETIISPGEHTYLVKGIGYSSAEGTFNVGDAETTVTLKLNKKEKAAISVSYTSTDGKKLKDTKSLGESAIDLVNKQNYTLDEAEKENITLDEKIYEYNPDLSSDTSFDVYDDTEIKLVFNERTLPDSLGTEIFRTNFSKDGFSKDNTNNHGYTVNDGVVPSYGTDSNGTKYATYSTADGLTINLPNGGYDNFMAEFDMSFNEADIPGVVVGLVLCSGANEGNVAGVRNNGSKGPKFAVGNANKNVIAQEGKNIEIGKIYRYVLECNGETLKMTVGDKTTGEVIDTIENYELYSNIKGKNIDTLKFKNLSAFQGNAKINLANLKVYQIGGPNFVKWPFEGDNINVDIPSETSIAPSEFCFKTGIDDYKITLSDKPSYEILNADGTLVSDSVSIDENGLITIGENVTKSDYKVNCSYNNSIIKTYNVKAIKNRTVDFYDSTAEGGADNIFTYIKPSPDDTAKWTGTVNGWKLEQKDGLESGREFFAEFSPSKIGRATLKFQLNPKPNALKPAEGDAEQKSYSFGIQMLDADYKDGENPDEHVNIGLLQEVSTKVGELQYYGKSIPMVNVKNDANIVHLEDDGTFTEANVDPRITARSSIVWGITVDFDFDKDLASLAIICMSDGKNSDGTYKEAYGYGYKYDNIPISNGFKTLRFITEGDVSADDVTLNKNGQTQPMLKFDDIKNVSYSRYIFEPENIDPSTIEIKGGPEAISLNFEEPEKNHSSVIYTASLVDPDGNPIKDANGNDVTQKSNFLPIIFDNILPGNYSCKAIISAVNDLGEIEAQTDTPVDIVVTSSIIEANIENDIIEDGILNLDAVVTNPIEALNGVVIVSVYDKDGRLIASDYNENSIQTGESRIPFSLEINDIKDFTIKLYIWKDLQSMEPILMEALSKEISSEN